MFNIYNKDSRDWTIPRDAMSREFALDLIIDALVNFRDYSGATDNVVLPEACIRWLIKEGQNEFKKEENLLELEAPIKILGDIHG